ncbi:Transcriptional regulator containing PAS, AAA-type ATPase, and DNA-binding Fis domains [Tindallia magadiensis]|uniref:Transcriptional regulator containing PAS, AAA-type ATPase, and DNA-binding Fis domains n=1 Tax=Tindallia magadiensis TaxID=69895 RepID=A0A1I3BWN6_9FIRM|nr:sigma 54-interacting transcriptional regulator [Tindallia magadiensis]SFH66600.1 Transcriptional regulator containing PAS, AAA-type ATPase, and DNA-binding Fis domains [Tindallia magadiensis]
MKQEIAIGAKYDYSRSFYEQLLKDILGPDFNISSYNLSEPQNHSIQPDIFLISTPFIANEMKPLIHPKTKVISINRTFSRASYHLLKTIPSNQDILVVNNGIDVTFETISLIYALGFNFKLYPHYPDSTKPLDIQVAITTNETHLVPDSISQSYNIGHMVYSLSTINEVLENLDIEQSVKNKILYRYERQVVSNETGVYKLLGKNVASQYELQAVLDLIEEGVIRINTQDKITMINNKAQQILNRPKEFLYQKPLADILPLPFKISEYPIHDYFLSIGNEQLIFSSQPTHIFDKRVGSIITLKKVTELRKLEEQVRQNNARKGHTTKYSFDHILGSSSSILQAKKQAQKMAVINSTIVIIGESGTGKELFAQAIHKQSHRNKFPFIAINCAALPESLIESELFGYESGAFTGASKTGRSGLFEDAHLGTLFLDEIGDLSLPLQAKLLRVLESQEVIRLGSNKVRNVDVRIIAATNKDLRLLAEQGDMRWDFYYRLNVFPLRIPPLRERKEDIKLLFHHLLHNFHCHKSVAPSLLKALFDYDWPGNIRELRNITEYLARMSEDSIEVDDLPPDFGCFTPKPSSQKESPNIEHFILTLLLKREQQGLRTGRTKILHALNDSDFFITERVIRNYLKDLELQGLIQPGKGRQGSFLTKEGKQLAFNLSQN